jgi:hypothetical protein
VSGRLSLDDRGTGSGTRAEDAGLNAGFDFIRRRNFSSNDVNSIGFDQRHGATTKAAAGHPATIYAAIQTDGFRDFNHGIKLLAAHFIIIAERTMAVIHQPAGGQPVRGANLFGRLEGPFNFADDVPRPAENSIAHLVLGRFKLIHGRVTQRGDTENLCRLFTFGPALRIFAPA